MGNTTRILRRQPTVTLRPLMVSRSTAHFLANGHPWVKPDRFTRGLDKLQPGDQVALVGDGGERLASAVVDPKGEICARVYDWRPDRGLDAGDLTRRAWARRHRLHDDQKTDCYRVVHGEADALPGLRVERFGSTLVLVATSPCIEPYLGAVAAALHEPMPDAVKVIRRHYADQQVDEPATTIWTPAGEQPVPDPQLVVTGRELGVSYQITPYAGLATGLYVDQRATRAWLRREVKGRRVLNLFAYTGAFSLCALAQGAAAALDVDLSAPALARAAANAAANGSAARHRTQQADCRTFLRECAESFDLVICDPPTAAQGGDEGWVLRRDYEELLKLAAARLAPGGLLLATCNTINGKPFPLAEAMAAAMPAGADVEGPGFGDDLPQLPGFPEGRPFRLALRRAPGGVAANP